MFWSQFHINNYLSSFCMKSHLIIKRLYIIIFLINHFKITNNLFNKLNIRSANKNSFIHHKIVSFKYLFNLRKAYAIIIDYFLLNVYE